MKDLSLCFLNRTIPKQISEVFSAKCEIISYCIAVRDFFPDTDCKITQNKLNCKIIRCISYIKCFICNFAAMLVYTFDRTLDELLTAVFDAFALRRQPEMLVGEGAMLPLFTEEMTGW